MVCILKYRGPKQSMAIMLKKLCKTNPPSTIQLGDYNIEIATSILQFADHWSMVAPADIFFSIDFLQFVEQNAPSDITPYYGMVFQKGEPIGIIYLQHKRLNLNENLRLDKPKNGVERVQNFFKSLLISQINFHSIVCGNLLLTGKYGLYFKSHIPKDSQFELAEATADSLRSNLLQNQGTKISLVLIKDYFDYNIPSPSTFEHFTKFKVQPKMMVQLDPEWTTFDDYVGAMKSKYRVRVRKALQKSEKLIKKEFNYEDLVEHRSIIFRLYKNVSDEAGFNAFILQEKYFENLKLALGDQMKCTTYWADDKLIGFFTSIKNYNVLDAHFLGYDKEENNTYQLYLNMLYDLIKEGINKSVSVIDLSRTAIEIKSTVGAEPYDMSLFLKHTNPILNKAVGPVLNMVTPKVKFILRNPFRD